MLAKFVPVARSFSVVRRRPWLLHAIQTLGLEKAAFPSIPIRRHRESIPAVAASSIDGDSLGSSAVNQCYSNTSCRNNPISRYSSRAKDKFEDDGSSSQPDENDATVYVLWGLTLGVVSDLLEVANLAPLTPKGAPSFTFPLAPVALDATIRAIYKASSSGFDRRGAGAAAAVTAIAVFVFSFVRP